MTTGQDALEETVEELFEDAPCGYLTTRLDGTIVRVNRTFEDWTGLRRDDLIERRRFQHLLSPGGRIYYETHYAPLLEMQGSVREIAVEIVRADGSRLPALVNSVLRRDGAGRPRAVRTTVFDATARRSYERELLSARRREHEIAQQLQRSLLAGELPAGPEFAVDVAYRPAVQGLDVGGDWYDAFRIGDGRTLGLVVGDVAGRGIGAAATMGQLRSAVRALASTGLGPAALLEALDGYARRHDVGGMATLVYGELDLDEGRLCFACAGHPPPALVRPGEDPCLLWDGRSMPLEVGLDSSPPRAQAAHDVPSGTSLLLYTDGLIERRTQPLDEGLDRMLRELARQRGETGAVRAGELIRALADAEHPDDVCVLAARVGEPGGP